MLLQGRPCRDYFHPHSYRSKKAILQLAAEAADSAIKAAQAAAERAHAEASLSRAVLEELLQQQEGAQNIGMANCGTHVQESNSLLA